MLKAFFDWLFRRQQATPPASPRLTNPQDFAQLNRDAPLRAGGTAGTAPGLPARTASSATDDSTDGTDHTPAMVTYLCREAVLGRDQRIAGYQFMLHEGTRNRIRNSSRRVHHLYAEILVRNLVRADIGRQLQRAHQALLQRLQQRMVAAADDGDALLAQRIQRVVERLLRLGLDQRPAFGLQHGQTARRVRGRRGLGSEVEAGRAGIAADTFRDLDGDRPHVDGAAGMDADGDSRIIGDVDMESYAQWLQQNYHFVISVGP